MKSDGLVQIRNALVTGGTVDLKGVKWAHLVEQIQNENAERAARLRFEIGQSRKENKKFLENVERGKKESGIQATRERRGDADADAGAGAGEAMWAWPWA